MYVVNEQTKIVNIWSDTDKNRKRLKSGKYSVVEYLGEVEQGCDGNWYAAGFAPHEPEPTLEEQNEAIRMQRSIRMTTEADPLKYDYEEAVARGAADVEELKAVWLAKKDEIREQLPYIAEKTEASEENIPEA